VVNQQPEKKEALNGSHIFPDTASGKRNGKEKQKAIYLEAQAYHYREVRKEEGDQKRLPAPKFQSPEFEDLDVVPQAEPRCA